MKNTLRYALTFLCLYFSSLLNASATGGGNLNPGIVANKESLERFQDMKVGLSVHWGPSSLGGKEISWSRGKQISKDVYDAFYQEFNPVKFDAEAWVQLAKDGGMQYISLTSKHHDGFSLWFSDASPYDMMNTPFGRDIVRELSDACRKHGIVFGSYYSIIDWYHPDYHPQGHGGPGDLIPAQEDSPDFERYIEFMKHQLHELIVDYGAEIVQFDGEWESSWNHMLGSDLYLYCRKLNDQVLVSSRADVGRYHKDPSGAWNWRTYAGDYEERERMVDWVKGDHEEVYGLSEVPWQAWVTIDQSQWSYSDTPRLMSEEEVIKDLLMTVGDNGNYLINLGPRPDGTFDPDQVSIVRHVGQWLKAHQEGIYDTRGGPWRDGSKYTSTIKDKTVHLFVIDDSLTSFQLPLMNQSVSSVDLIGMKSKNLSFTQTNDELQISLSGSGGSQVRVLKVVFE